LEAETRFLKDGLKMAKNAKKTDPRAPSAVV